MTTEGDHQRRLPESTESRHSRASVGRLSLYLRRLETLVGEGISRVSSSSLGESLGITDTQVRKDLAPLALGLPGVGYEIADLISTIRSTLGIDRIWPAALIGVGNLGRALLRYHGFVERGFKVVALFDNDPTLVGQAFQCVEVYHPDRMSEVIAQTGAELGIIAVPGEVAQSAAELMIEGGIRGLLNFAPGVIRVPSHIPVVHVDLTIQLEQLAFLVQMEKVPRGT